MDVVHAHACGLDVHKASVAACILATRDDGTLTREVRTFGTMTPDLLELADWLTLYGVTHVALESTGVYWKPIYNLLEGTFDLLLVNAQHIKHVPGRKTDVRDCEWLAELLRYGLVRGSFVPNREQRELRELTRYRTSLIRERSAEVNRLQKTLEGANLKLGSVATDVMGKSGRAILRALVEGTTDPKELADLAQGQLREKIPQLERALTGRIGEHQRFLLRQQLTHLADLERVIAAVSTEIAERMRPFEAALEQLDTIPGVSTRTAQVLIAEIGADMGRFPSAGHLASWAGMCPGQHESAGKRRSGKTRKGSVWLRTALVEAGQAAGRTKTTYLGAQFRRLAARRGGKRAAVAVGHSILVIAYSLLRRQTTYRDLGPSYFDQRDRERLERRLVARLEKLGNKVTLERTKEAA